MTNTISNTGATIDSRDVIARIEELEQERDTAITYAEAAAAFAESDEGEELTSLSALMEQCKGMGGDEEWRGDWYPVTLIRDDYFAQAMDELCEDIGDIPKDLPCYLSIVIDYEALQRDYSAVDFDGVTYWVR